MKRQQNCGTRIEFNKLLSKQDEGARRNQLLEAKVRQFLTKVMHSTFVLWSVEHEVEKLIL